MSNKNVYHGEWAGCSDLKERRKELNKAHEEFQKMLDNGYQVKVTGVKHKRPRIVKPKAASFKIIITCFGPMKITIEEYNQHCKDFKTL